LGRNIAERLQKPCIVESEHWKIYANDQIPPH
jgi:hypothetical protein